MYQSDYCPIIYRKELKKKLQLSSKQIAYLVDGEIILTRFIGKSEIVHNPSLKKFQSSFNVNDYYTKNVVIAKLKEKSYLAEYSSHWGLYDTYFMGFPHTFNNFVKKGYLITYKIASTTYVSKKSFDRLMILLDNTYKELYGKEFKPMYDAVKQKIKNYKPSKVNLKFFKK